MIVYFSASSRELEERLEDYNAITKAIYENDGILARNWLDEAVNRKGDYPETYMESILERAKLGILSSEVIIVEASGSSTFGVGYETALAIENKKPILALIKTGSERSSYVSGIKNGLVTQQIYNVENLGKIIGNFLRENMVASKDLRFNFVIDRQIYNHLRWKSYRSGKTKAEVVRDLLIEDIEKRGRI